MTTKKFFTIILLVVLGIFSLIVLSNILINPFGIFKGDLLDWDSYNFTQNPRTAKISYIDQNHESFDSYIVGSSGAGALDPDLLSHYSEKKYYNSFYYGSDLLDSYNTIKYLGDKYQVKEIFLGINYNTAMYFDEGEDELNLRMPAKVSGKSQLEFYRDYLFANPRYFLSKLGDYIQDSHFQKSFDVFIPETGMYDKRVRDVENIGDYQEFLNKEDYQVFQNYPESEKNLEEMAAFEKNMKEIVDYCQARGIDLKVVVLPIYADDFQNYPLEDLKTFYSTLASITDFWDFSKSTISTDPRYFYDSTHFRNSVGDMILAKIYGDTSPYYPQDFGHYVDQNTLENFFNTFANYPLEEKRETYSTSLPVLMFHDIGEGEYSITSEQFQRQMNLLKNNGYQTISLDELYAYTERGKALPEKPILITFDDGYMSNYQYAYPILKDLDMKAVIYIIGSSLGKDTYKETNYPIIPHFGLKEAKEMVESGHIEIQSHSFDMHQANNLEEHSPARINVAKFDEESEKEYIKAFEEDFKKQNQAIETITGESCHSFSYPTGIFTMESETLLGELGVKSSMTSEKGINTIIKGLPQSLHQLKRINIDRNLSDEELLKLLNP